MIKIKLILSFIKWMFMKMFGGCFNKAEVFREELKKGAPDSIFAICAFLILSLISLLVILFTSAWFIDDKDIVGIIGASAFWIAVSTFVYNVVKASFECFLAERARLFDILRDSK